jgi:hypothetical protein
MAAPAMNAEVLEDGRALLVAKRDKPFSKSRERLGLLDDLPAHRDWVPVVCQ